MKKWRKLYEFPLILDGIFLFMLIVQLTTTTDKLDVRGFDMDVSNDSGDKITPKPTFHISIDVLIWAVIAIQIIVGIFGFIVLPDTVPIHWGINGQANGLRPKVDKDIPLTIDKHRDICAYTGAVSCWSAFGRASGNSRQPPDRQGHYSGHQH